MMFLGVIAAIALIFGLNTVRISKSMNKANELKKVYGSYHTEYVGITLDQLNKLMGDKDISAIDDVQNISKSMNKANELKKVYGSYHTEYVGITLDQLNKLMGDKDISAIDDVQNLGEIVTDNGLKTELKSFEGKYVSAPYYFSMKSQELVGRKARNNNEIGLDEEAAKIFGIKEQS